MIVILSAFNGIDDLVQDLYSSLDADITVEALRGKTIDSDSIDVKAIIDLPEVDWIAPVVEDNVILSYGEKQRIATIKGVDNQYLEKLNFEKNVVEGLPKTTIEGLQYGIVGYGIKQELGAGIYAETFKPLTIFAPRKGKKIYKNREGATKKKQLMTGGVFSINVEFDTKYLVTSLEFAKDLFDLDTRISHFEIKVKEGFSPEEVKATLDSMLDSNYKLVTQKEKNALIYKANESERLITIFILAFIVIIATFNIFAS